MHAVFPIGISVPWHGFRCSVTGRYYGTDAPNSGTHTHTLGAYTQMIQARNGTTHVQLNLELPFLNGLVMKEDSIWNNGVGRFEQDITDDHYSQVTGIHWDAFRSKFIQDNMWKPEPMNRMITVSLRITSMIQQVMQRIVWTDKYVLGTWNHCQTLIMAVVVVQQDSRALWQQRRWTILDQSKVQQTYLACLPHGHHGNQS